MHVKNPAGKALFAHSRQAEWNENWMRVLRASLFEPTSPQVEWARERAEKDAERDRALMPARPLPAKG